jgi:protein-tyrosine-phosphatase
MARSLTAHHILTRRTLGLGLLLVPTMASAQDAPCAPISVLFVCQAGTVKIAIASETLKRRATEAGVQVRVSSRGIHPEDHVSAALAANLKADGLYLGKQPALRLSKADVATADIVIAFDKAVQAPELRGARSWDIPSWNADYEGAKAALSAQLDRLMAELRVCPNAAVNKER